MWAPLVCQLVLLILTLCWAGKLMWASTSVSLSSMKAARFGYLARNWSAVWRSVWLALTRSG